MSDKTKTISEEVVRIYLAALMNQAKTQWLNALAYDGIDPHEVEDGVVFSQRNPFKKSLAEATRRLQEAVKQYETGGYEAVNMTTNLKARIA